MRGEGVEHYKRGTLGGEYFWIPRGTADRLEGHSSINFSPFYSVSILEYFSISRPMHHEPAMSFVTSALIHGPYPTKCTSSTR